MGGEERRTDLWFFGRTVPLRDELEEEEGYVPDNLGMMQPKEGGRSGGGEGVEDENLIIYLS